MPGNMLAAALLYVGSGLSVIPIRRDSSKAPALREWRPYQFRRPTEAELQEWFGNNNNYGIAIIGGAISNSLEIFDCDAPELFDPWCKLVEFICPGLLLRLVIIQTPSGGFHVYYRSAEVEGNQKLAQRLLEVPEGTVGGRWVNGRYVKVVTLLETRGEGGYVLAPPTPPECHPAHKPYTLLSGNLTCIPMISSEERDTLLDAAHSFNEYIQQEQSFDYSPTIRKAGKVLDLEMITTSGQIGTRC